ncbi:MAG: hypothetical protein PHV16_02190, partial [Candidatus Nanoarchaeia archaeon]|nr:hypothetical protein [Candidatus Nanoarchaeia archaeon]
MNGVILAAVSVICFYGFLVWYTKKSLSVVGKIIFISGISFLVYSLVNFIWAFGAISPYESDFIFIGGLFNVITASLLLVIIYNFVDDKNLLYLLFLFILTVFAMPSNINMFFSILSFISCSIIAIASFDLFLISEKLMRKIGMFLILFSFLSILILIIFKNNLSAIIWFLPNIVLFIVFFLFVKNIEAWGSNQNTEKISKKKKASYPLLFIKFVVFVSLITILSLLSTIVIHELGHFLA